MSRACRKPAFEAASSSTTAESPAFLRSRLMRPSMKRCASVYSSNFDVALGLAQAAGSSTMPTARAAMQEKTARNG
jgi:hypothetical protein